MALKWWTNVSEVYWRSSENYYNKIHSLGNYNHKNKDVRIHVTMYPHGLGKYSDL